MKIAVDTGGTFTDVILSAPDGRGLVAHKLLSTPDDPARAVLAGIAVLVGEAVPAVIHGSTVATNALLEGKGGRAAFVTTSGFEDTLHIARQNRPSLYALSPQRPAPPIPRDRCLGVVERVRCDGQVLRALDEASCGALVARLGALGVEAVAVSLLHSYANPDHERALGAALGAALPGVHVTLSSALLPEFREYERGATCAVNAVVAPKMGAYLGRLESALGGGLRIMASNGGSMSAAEARRTPVHTVLSGPAGGVVGALASAGEGARIVSFDMGGTSTDVSLCEGGLTLTAQGAVGPLPVRVPLIDIHTVGAGGGSLAWIDAGGALRVGPQSAGADPGPACYGRQRGAWQPTVTDAHVVLGRLRPSRFLGGGMALDAELSRAAIASIAAPLGLSPEAAALGILRVAEATMCRAIKVISVERGHDVRDFALVCFGGAGGLHACSLAEALGMGKVLIPNHPGLLSAVGMLFAHSVHTLSRGIMRRVARAGLGSLPEVRRAFEHMRAEASARLDAEGFEAERQVVVESLDLRYAGQSHELTIPLDGGEALAAFEARHQRLYGYTSPTRDIEVVTARLRAEGRVDPPSPPTGVPRHTPFEGGEPIRAWFRDHLEAGALVSRADLRPGDRLSGPLVVTEYSSTHVVPSGWSLCVEGASTLSLEREDV